MTVTYPQVLGHPLGLWLCAGRCRLRNHVHKSTKVWLVCSYMHNFCSNYRSSHYCLHIHMHTTASSLEYLDARIDALTEPCVAELERQGFKRYLDRCFSLWGGAWVEHLPVVSLDENHCCPLLSVNMKPSWLFISCSTLTWWSFKVADSTRQHLWPPYKIGTPHKKAPVTNKLKWIYWFSFQT